MFLWARRCSSLPLLCGVCEFGGWISHDALSTIESSAAGKPALKHWLESCAVLCVTATIHRRQYP